MDFIYVFMLRIIDQVVILVMRRHGDALWLLADIITNNFAIIASSLGRLIILKEL